MRIINQIKIKFKNLIIKEKKNIKKIKTKIKKDIFKNKKKILMKIKWEDYFRTRLHKMIKKKNNWIVKQKYYLIKVKKEGIKKEYIKDLDQELQNNI